MHGYMASRLLKNYKLYQQVKVFINKKFGLYGAQFLNCAQLAVTRNWQSAFRDDALACDADIPERRPSE
jgi:hypothetical protein